MHYINLRFTYWLFTVSVTTENNERTYIDVVGFNGWQPDAHRHVLTLINVHSKTEILQRQLKSSINAAPFNDHCLGQDGLDVSPSSHCPVCNTNKKASQES